MTKVILLLLLLISIAAGTFLFLKSKDKIDIKMSEITTKSVDNFGTPKKSIHFESSIPEHGSTLPEAPINIVINFNFDLSAKSKIEITKGGTDYGIGKTLVDKNKLALRRGFAQNAPDGVYSVTYSACWPDGSCHDGNFKFKIDRSKSSSFLDMTGQKEVTIDLKDLAFSPQFIKVSLGTKVTWVNSESVGHYINTDPHPGHSYYVPQNSKLLENGDKYSLSFNQKGYYPYHCSAHPEMMTGAIIVE